MTATARLHKVIADRGFASRRAAEELIREGRVRVGGQLVRELGTSVPVDARISIDGRAVPATPRRRYVMLHKPSGTLSTARDERGRPTVVQLVAVGPRAIRERMYPVGRLDADSEGLLLLTNDGAWAERVLHPRYGHEREYEVDAQGRITPEAVTALRTGVRLEEGVARATAVRLVRRTAEGGTLRLVVRSGWKRQVRRMCAAVGLRVLRLLRVRVGPLSLGTLRRGAWRDLTAAEVRSLAGAAR